MGLFCIQIADSLDHLELITRNLFNGIRFRIDQNLEQLNAIDKRFLISEALFEFL